ncbi:hypothetical protein ACTWQB_16520 [Piscibacillus sp. B03]|uniref:hypothetical protein n=1 Tax=Piscibacillus sp. B03 TaxID=3457430 RepID=UPI003FCCDA27
MLEWIIIIIVSGYLLLAAFALIDLLPVHLMMHINVGPRFNILAKFVFLLIGAAFWDVIRYVLFDTFTIVTIWESILPN